MSTIDRILEDVKLPRMVKVKQSFDRPVLENIEESLLNRLGEKKALDRVHSGQRVAIAVGSRGIQNLPLLVKTLVRETKKAGGEPFVIPAMGSHGGGTAAGQKNMLAGMGISEETIEATIRATMDTVRIGTADNGLPVYVDKFAYEADAIIIINRIKPHVAFRGQYESGLLKMITIGLGKQKGAAICHEMGFGKMAENIPAMAKVTLAQTNLIFGVGILENAYHETCRIEVLTNEEIELMEPELQQEAKRLAPKLYFDDLDVLIIDEIGKDISGTGFDTNVVGRYHTPYASGGPQITRIAVLDITERSHGNGNGLGIADVTTRQAFEKFDFEQTYPNALTSTVPVSVKIPMVLKNDLQAIQATIKTCNILDKSQVRLVRIKNTLSLDEIEVSENLLSEAENNPHLLAAGRPYEWRFAQDGNFQR
ncbi:MAG: nickel pincer cofactor-dependent isomerase, group 22 [Desulfitobacteriaceae bacterium]